VVIGRGIVFVCVSVGRGVRGVVVLPGPLCPGPPVGGPRGVCVEGRVGTGRVTVTVALGGGRVVGCGGGQLVGELEGRLVENGGGSRGRVLEGGGLRVQEVEVGGSRGRVLE
jgi:hypothetical protein